MTCQSKSNVLVSWILQVCLNDALWTSLERPIIWSPGCLATGSLRRLTDVPVFNFRIFALSVKNRNTYIIQELLFLENIFSLNHQFLCWFPESPLKLPYRSRMLEHLGGPQGDALRTLRVVWVHAWYCWHKVFSKIRSWSKILIVFCKSILFYNLYISMKNKFFWEEKKN